MIVRSVIVSPTGADDQRGLELDHWIFDYLKNWVLIVDGGGGAIGRSREASGPRKGGSHMVKMMERSVAIGQLPSEPAGDQREALRRVAARFEVKPGNFRDLVEVIRTLPDRSRTSAKHLDRLVDHLQIIDDPELRAEMF